jgi:pimeloyl-ACP methyl ester carboxylesterase
LKEIAMHILEVCKPARCLMTAALCLGLSWAVFAGTASPGAKPPVVAAAAGDTVASKDGLNIAFEAAGQGEPALVFVHGWAGNKSFWRAQLDYFSPKYKVAALDLAGHGESAAGREFYTVEAFGDDVAAVVEKLNPARVILIGHSEGGRVCIRAARAIGDKVIGIIGIDSLQDMSERYSPDQLDRALKPFKDDFRGTTAAFVRTLFPEKADKALVDRVAAQMASVNPAVGLSALRSEALFNVKADLTGLRVPIRVINGDRFPTNVAADRAIYRNYDMIPIAGVGHFPMLEDPAGLNKLLEGVITEFAARK